MELAIPAVIAAFVVGVVFVVKSLHRRTSERNPDESTHISSGRLYEANAGL